MSFDQQRRTNTRRALWGSLIVWLLGFIAAAPAYFATYMAFFMAALPIGAATVDSPDSDAIFQAWLNIVCLCLFGAALLLSPVLTLRYADAWIPRMFKARQPNDSERRLVRNIETLTPETGAVVSPEVLIVDADAINAALLGTSKSGWTLLITSGCVELQWEEQEALLAIAIADAATGGVTSGRLLLTAAGPVVALSRLVTAIATPKRIAFTLGVVSALNVAGGFILDGSLFGALGFATVLGVGQLIFAMPAIALWLALLAGIQTIVAASVMKPARLAADAGAVALTRFIPPIRRILVRARTAKTRPGTFPIGLGAIWALPVGTESSKMGALHERIRHLDSLDPNGAIRSLGG